MSLRSDLHRSDVGKELIELLALPQAYKPRVGDWIRPQAAVRWNWKGTVPAGQLNAYFIQLQRRMRFDRIGINISVAGAAGALVRLGVYKVNQEYYPTSLILDAGEIDASTAGNKNIPIDLTLDRGWYTLAYLSNDGTVETFQTWYGVFPLGPDVPGDEPAVDGWAIDGITYGPLPDPFPTGAFQRGFSRVMLRVAALL